MNNYYEPYTYNMYSLQVRKNVNKRKIFVVFSIIIFIITLFVFINFFINKQKAIKCASIYEEQVKQLEKELEEQKKIEEEKIKNEKLPNLTQEGIKNVEEIYKSETKRAFLTFDDGPSKNVTVPILDLLKQENIKATFFVLGGRVDLYPDIVKRAYEEGHYIANHGYTHKYSSIYASPQAVFDEYNRTNEAVRNAIGVQEYNSHLFRFPGGLVGGKYSEIKNQAKQLLNENNIVNVDWNALTGDSEIKDPTVEKLMEKLVYTVQDKNSVVILMHDAGNKNITVEVLPKVISYLRENGYEFQNFYDVIK